MKIKELLETIKRLKKEYPDFLEWDIALEQHPDWKLCPNCNKPEDYVICKDESIPDQNGNPTKTLFIKSHCMGCCTYWTKRKIFGIQIHF